MCVERAHHEADVNTRSSYLAEGDQESAEVTGGVAADGVLQALSVLWKEGVAFFRKIHSFA